MFTTIIEAIEHHAHTDGNKNAFVFVDEKLNETDSLTFSELYSQASSIAVYLQTVSQPGDRVLLLFQPGLDYIRVLFACFLAGVIAVPLYPPRRNKKADRIARVADSCDYSLILCGEQDKQTITDNFYSSHTELDADLSLDEKASAIRLHTVEFVQENIPDQALQERTINESDIAFLQYTSGSTGAPKGVMIAHSNVIGNVDALKQSAFTHNGDVFVNWLPLFHDLGLITAVMLPAYLGSTSVLMAPASFIRNPVLWLQAISQYSGTICGAPNFAYQLCVKRIVDDVIPTLNLSSWRVAYNAAEPINPETIDHFNHKFASAQFRPTAQLASYGMAEATAFVSCTHIDEEIAMMSVDAAELVKHKVVLSQEENKSRRLVGCGKTTLPHDIKIVDPERLQPLADDEIGEIWFSGPSVAQGYWKLEDISATTFKQSLAGYEGSYMRTGDFGFLHDNEVYITGRMKDLIIIEGRNYYPQDIEWHIEESAECLSTGSTAAFTEFGDDGEKLCVVAEIGRTSLRTTDFQELVNHIRRSVIQEFFINPSLVVIVKPLSMPKTSSGKIQRKATKALLLENALEIVFRSDSQVNNTYVPPTTDCEHLLCELMCRVLERDQISIDDNFFDLGGKSLTAMQLIAEIKQHFDGIELSFEQLFSSLSVREMAGYLEKRQHLLSLQKNISHHSDDVEEFEI